jgi:hypothetical protein
VKVDGKRVALGRGRGLPGGVPKIKAAQARVITDDMAARWSWRASCAPACAAAEDIIDQLRAEPCAVQGPAQIEFCESF